MTDWRGSGSRDVTPLYFLFLHPLLPEPFLGEHERGFKFAGVRSRLWRRCGFGSWRQFNRRDKYFFRRLQAFFLDRLHGRDAWYFCRRFSLNLRVCFDPLGCFLFHFLNFSFFFTSFCILIRRQLRWSWSWSWRWSWCCSWRWRRWRSWLLFLPFRFNLYGLLWCLWLLGHFKQRLAGGFHQLCSGRLRHCIKLLL